MALPSLTPPVEHDAQELFLPVQQALVHLLKLLGVDAMGDQVVDLEAAALHGVNDVREHALVGPGEALAGCGTNAGVVGADDLQRAAVEVAVEVDAFRLAARAAEEDDLPAVVRQAHGSGYGAGPAGGVQDDVGAATA